MGAAVPGLASGVSGTASAPPPEVSAPPKPEGAEWAKPLEMIDKVTYRADGGGYLKPGFDHLFVVPASGGAPRQLVEPPVTLVTICDGHDMAERVEDVAAAKWSDVAVRFGGLVGAGAAHRWCPWDQTHERLVDRGAGHGL